MHRAPSSQPRRAIGRRFLLLAAALPALFFTLSEAQAATATGSFSVQVTITATCVVSSTTTMNFGSQGVLSANVDQTSAINVTCTNTTPYNIGLDKGVNGASVTTRQMKAGAALINYSLFSDSGRTTNWGNTVGTDTVAGTGNGSAQAFTVYGRIPPQATPAAGAYTDTITVTVTY
jgi:spore coat protein U-like protein